MAGVAACRCCILAAAAGLAWLIRWQDAQALLPPVARLASLGHLGAAVGSGRVGAVSAVAAGDRGCGIEVAAEHHRRGGGRLAQHGHCGHDARHTRERGLDSAAERRAGGLKSGFRRACTASAIDSRQSISNAAMSHHTETATHISDGLKQLAADTSDLPVGAVVLLSDGGENTASTSGSESARRRSRRYAIAAFRCTRWVSGKERAAHDVEIEDVSHGATRHCRLRASPRLSP